MASRLNRRTIRPCGWGRRQRAWRQGYLTALIDIRIAPGPEDYRLMGAPPGRLPALDASAVAQAAYRECLHRHTDA